MSKRAWVAAVVLAVVLLGTAAYAEYGVVPDWLKARPGHTTIGNMHGDVAVSSAGDVYVSVQDPEAGLQVYDSTGKFLRSVPNAPSDFHGFVIRKQADGEFIYGATLRGQTVVKMTLEGKVVFTIPATAVPEQFKTRNARSGQVAMLLTGLDVAPNGDIYVADGYASDNIHRFNREGKYIESFGGKAAPYSFNTMHKLAMDTRFDPVRILGVDRANNRAVHMGLDGKFLAVVAEGLLLPAAVTIKGDLAIIGELRGRVSILDKTGKVVAQVGANTGEGVGTNSLAPEKWLPGLVVSPHGVATNARGDLFVAEFSTFGRVHRFNLK